MTYTIVYYLVYVFTKWNLTDDREAIRRFRASYKMRKAKVPKKAFQQVIVYPKPCLRMKNIANNIIMQ